MKKKLSQKQFDRRIKIWSVIISPILIALIGALTTMSVAYFSNTPTKNTQIPEVEYGITMKDSLDIEILSTQIDTLIKRYNNTDDPIELDKLDVELKILAQREADIYLKYFPRYTPRWPERFTTTVPETSPYNDYDFLFIGIIILIPLLILLILGVMFAIRPLIRKIFHGRYEIVK